MKTDSYLIVNGRLVKSSGFSISPANRAFQYGDGVFETMHYHHGILYIDDHYKRLTAGLKALKMKFPAQLDKSRLAGYAVRLVEEHHIRGDARLRLQVFRDEGGFYAPAADSSSFIMTVSRLGPYGFDDRIKGLQVDFCRDVVIPAKPIRNHKTCNALPYVLAGVYAKENRIDDCLLLNERGRIAEAVASNVFILRKGALHTPPLRDGCVNGVMRKQVFRLAKKLKLEVKERSLSRRDIANADEVFLTNVTQGIRWVETCSGKKKKGAIAGMLQLLLNEETLLLK